MAGAACVLVTSFLAMSFDRIAGASINLRSAPRPSLSMQPSQHALALVATSSNLSHHHDAFGHAKKGDMENLMRPNAGNGKDEILFSLFAKNFYGDDLKDANFQIDVVISLEWKDQRIIDLIPAGLDSVTISSDVARQRMWMPDVVVSNRDIDKTEIISSSVTLNRDGQAVKVERVHVKICEKFVLIDYPFDTEHFKVIIASSKYMLDDLVLVPNTRANSSGVDCPFGGYNVEGFTLTAFEETDGDLEKSRGMIDISATRKLEKYRQDHLVPTFIVLTISCAVFYFPMVGPFVTPRLALSILALLTFTNLMIKSTNALPGPAPYNWNDLLNQQVQGLMFLVIVTNIFSEICEHTLQVQWLARRLNYEAKFFFPCFAAFDVIFVLLTGNYEWMTLHGATITIQTISFLIVGSYAAWVILMLMAERRTRQLKEANPQADPMSARMDMMAIVTRASERM